MYTEYCHNTRSTGLGNSVAPKTVEHVHVPELNTLNTRKWIPNQIMTSHVIVVWNFIDNFIFVHGVSSHLGALLWLWKLSGPFTMKVSPILATLPIPGRYN